MNRGIPYDRAHELVTAVVQPVGTEQVPLEEVFGRVLAEPLIAKEHVPPFDRSPYDGYAFRSWDVQNASPDHPVTLRVLEEIPAGGAAHYTVEEGTAAKVLTGAPIPPGADTVCMFEKTLFTEDSVTIFYPSKYGSNIIRKGEDVLKGTVLAPVGTVIDAGLAGTLGAQNVPFPLVYRQPVVGIISTGSELVVPVEPLEPGKIYNSNGYTFTAILKKLGCQPKYLGTAGDSVREIADLIRQGLASCDALILTGGVSVGDYDLTPEAMLDVGATMLFRGVDMKPGMACAYGVCNGKLICGLSGNPASSVTNFYAVALDAIRKLCGQEMYAPKEIQVTLKHPFRKKSPCTRFLRGKLELQDGVAQMELPEDQGNVVLSSTIGCDIMAVVPAGSGPLDAGTTLKGFLI